MIVSHVNGFWSNERKHFIIKVYDLFAMVFTLLLHGIAVCVWVWVWACVVTRSLLYHYTYLTPFEVCSVENGCEWNRFGEWCGVEWCGGGWFKYGGVILIKTKLNLPQKETIARCSCHCLAGCLPPSPPPPPHSLTISNQNAAQKHESSVNGIKDILLRLLLLPPSSLSSYDGHGCGSTGSSSSTGSEARCSGIACS